MSEIGPRTSPQGHNPPSPPKIEDHSPDDGSWQNVKVSKLSMTCGARWEAEVITNKRFNPGDMENGVDTTEDGWELL